MKVKVTIRIEDEGLDQNLELNEETVKEFIECSDLFDKIDFKTVMERIVTRGVKDMIWRKNDLNKRLQKAKVERQERKAVKFVLGI